MWLTIGLWIFATILGEVLRPKTKRAGLDAGQLEIPDNRQDRKIPVIFGLAEIRGPLLGTYGLIKSEAITQEVETSPFSSESTTVGYRYYVGMQLICCHGQVDEFLVVKFGRKTAISGTIQDGQVLIDKPTLFGPADQQGGIKGKMTFHSGATNQAPDAFMQALLGEVPAHGGLAYCVWSNEYGDGGGYVGNSPNPPEVWITLRRYSKALGSGKHNIGGHCNPAEVLYELHVNRNFGAGLPESQIDKPSFLAAANTLHSEGFAYSRMWSEPTDVETMVLDVLEHIDALIYTDIATGKRTLKLARSDYDAGSLLELDDSNCTIDSFGRAAWDDTTNEVHVNYTDQTTGEGATAIAQDLANQAIQGMAVATTINYPGIPTLAQAQKVAWRDLRALSYPQAQARITANREAWTLRPGAVFKLTSADLGFSGMVMRVQKIGYGTLGDGRIQIDAVQDLDGFGDTIYGTPGASGWLDPLHAPVAATLQFLAEAPYFLAQTGGKILTWAAAPVYDAAEYQSQILQSGGIYTANSVVPFGATGLLDAGISETAATITLNTTQSMSMLASVSVADQRAGKNLAIIDNEWISFGGVAQLSAGIWQLTGVWRGVVDTVPAKHSAGARVYFLSGAAGTSPATYPVGQTVTAKYLPRTALGQLALGSATALTVTMNDRASRPYPPGHVQINGADYPAAILGAYTISWRHRDRVQQTTIYNQDDPSIGPESGQTYTLRLYGENNTLLKTASGLTGTNYAWTTEDADSGLLDPGDPTWANTSALLHMDGTNGSTTFADETGKVWTAAGGAQISTAQSKFGGASAAFNGTSSRITTPSHADFGFGSGDYTVEGWIYTTTQSGDRCIFDNRALGAGIGIYSSTGGGTGKLAVTNNAAIIATASVAFSSGVWQHWAVCRQSGIVRGFVDGAQVFSVTDSRTLLTGADALIGTNVVFSQYFSGYLDEIRIKKGVALYTAAFTPPAAPFYDFAGGLSSRLNGRVRAELESVRSSLVSTYKHDILVDRAGWGYNWDKYWSGP